MILSASRRTDIPCYYSEWFMNRVRAGYLLTRNPMNHAQLSRIPLTPDIVDCIVFWTKDAKNILPHLDELDGRGYKYYFQFTLTPYGRDIERNLRPKAEIEDTFITLSKRIGCERVVWRYDPVVQVDSGKLKVESDFHKSEFLRMCGRLAAFADTVVISFVDIYPKLKSDIVHPVSEDDVAELSDYIGKTAREYGLRAVACCEKYDLTKYGIARSSCIDSGRIEKICGCSLDLKPDKNQRDGCGCAESIDIGAYNTCPNGCVYCYANDSHVTTLRRHRSHNPESELLIGTVIDGEGITDRRAKSNKDITGFKEGNNV